MRLNRMLRQGLAIAAAMSIVTVWPAAPVFAADKNINLDGNTANGNESNVALNVVSTSPTQIKNKVTNKAVGQSFRYVYAGAGPGGFNSSVPLGTTAGVGAIWNWQTSQQVFSINASSTFTQTAPGTVTRTFADLPGRSLTSAGVTTSSASLTSSLITFFSPPTTLVEITSRVTPIAGGLFKYETEVKNLTDSPIEYGWQPGPAGCSSEDCGNGVREGSEACDGSDLDEASCELFGGSGYLYCDEGCNFDLSGCIDVCGNGVRDGEEQCEGSNLGGETCVSQGYASGELACDSECGYDYAGCVPSVCGNGVREGFESCDGSDLNDYSCTSLGYAGGTLGCDEGCGFDTSGCIPYECGNGVIEGTEECDGSELGGASCGSEGYECGFLGCAEDCTLDTSDCSNLCLGGAAAPMSSRTPLRGVNPLAKRTATGTALSAITAGSQPGSFAPTLGGLTRAVRQAARRSAAVSNLRPVPPQRSGPAPQTRALPVGEPGPCDFPGQDGRVDGNDSLKTCQVSAHPAKEVTSQIIVCGDGLPSGPEGCGTAPDSGTQGTANVLVPALDVEIGDAFLSTYHVAVVDGSNGFAEPGETFSLLVALINTGPKDLTDVTATLSAVAVDIDGDGTPDAPTITQATSAYPTIPGMPAGSADCLSLAAELSPVYNLTPFVVTLPASFPEDVNLHFVLTVDGTTIPVALGAFGQNVAFVVGVGGACSLTNLDGSYTRVDGFLSPMGALVPKGDPFPEDLSLSNRTRPLKVRLFCGDKNLNATDVGAPEIVALTRDGVPVDVNKVDLEDNANNHSLFFRYASGFWIYNMRSRFIGHGTFVITIRFANGQEYQSQFVM